MKILKITLPFCLIILLGGFSLEEDEQSWPRTEGKAVDTDSKLPLSDVFVVGRWLGSRNLFEGYEDVCFHTELAITDNEGAYRFKEWDNPKKYGEGLYSKRFVIGRLYKKGYITIEGEDTKHYLKKSNHSSVLDRLKYLSGINTSSQCNYNNNLTLLTKSLFNEALELEPKTKEEKILLEVLYSAYEMHKYGWEIGYQRYPLRVKEMKEKGFGINMVPRENIDSVPIKSHRLAKVKIPKFNSSEFIDLKNQLIHKQKENCIKYPPPFNINYTMSNRIVYCDCEYEVNRSKITKDDIEKLYSSNETNWYSIMYKYLKGYKSCIDGLE